MEIRVEFRRGEWRIRPDPAEVTRNEPITWVFEIESSPVRRLRWTIYFESLVPRLRGPGTLFPLVYVPLIRGAAVLQATSQNTGFSQFSPGDRSVIENLPSYQNREPIIDHRAITEPIAVEDPGDYKYGIRVENAENNEMIGDEDPRLIVR